MKFKEISESFLLYAKYKRITIVTPQLLEIPLLPDQCQQLKLRKSVIIANDVDILKQYIHIRRKED